MKVKLLLLVCLVLCSNLPAQSYSVYSNDSIHIPSTYLQEEIQLHLHLPETHPYSAATTKYPVVIVFDSQHERTYPHIIHSFDLLTSESQMPESIIVGVPFQMYNRLYLTSHQKKNGDELTGIERMELFLFSELLPLLQKNYQANEMVVLVGHSRTAFLVNYLVLKRPNQVSLAASLSGFFDESMVSVHSFFEFLSASSPLKIPLQYYCTAGTTREEENYLKEYKKLDSLLQSKRLPKHIKYVFQETPYANHITNYWVSIPSIFTEAFSSYNSILDEWFHEKLNSTQDMLTVVDFQKDLVDAGNAVGAQLNPSITQIYSLASHFLYQEEDIQAAIDFFELGVAYYPDYLDFYMDLIQGFKQLENFEKVKFYQALLHEKTLANPYLSEEKKASIQAFLEN